MAGNTQFEEFISEEVKTLKGVYVPVKAGILRRALIRETRCDKLHPNPDDEFCKPKVGPNYGIISDYMNRFREERGHSRQYCDERLVVEKIRPDGYLILNGHHRWAAALRLGYGRIPIEIVDLTDETDIREILKNSKHDKRVALDLDEVVFVSGDAPAEKPLPFPTRKVYKERLRVGVPALFRFLNKNGYDVWVYTAGYYSADYIRRLFKKYHVHISGAVTGLGRKTADGAKVRKEMETLIGNKYPVTIHVDNDMLLRVSGLTKEVGEYAIGGASAEWSQRVMEIIKKIEKHE